jgi:hypothetical protein
MLRRGTKQRCRACGDPLSSRSATFCEEHRLEHNANVKGSYQKNPDQAKKRIKLSTHRARVRVLQLLGGLVCAWCEEQDYRVLTIDHVRGVSPAERKHNGQRIDNNAFYYAILRGEIDAKTLRVLCMNCQIRNEHVRGNRKVLPELVPYIKAAGGHVPTTPPCSPV